MLNFIHYVVQYFTSTPRRMLCVNIWRCAQASQQLSGWEKQKTDGEVWIKCAQERNMSSNSLIQTEPINKKVHKCSIFKQRSCCIKVTVGAITHSLLNTYSRTLRLQMWKQLERVFVVGEVLSCHCMRQLMGNMKPRWSKLPDFGFDPDWVNLGQTWLIACWCI